MLQEHLFVSPIITNSHDALIQWHWRSPATRSQTQRREHKYYLLLGGTGACSGGLPRGQTLGASEGGKFDPRCRSRLITAKMRVFSGLVVVGKMRIDGSVSDGPPRHH